MTSAFRVRLFGPDPAVRSGIRLPQMRERLGEILVAPAGKPDQDQLRVELARPRERMRRLERRDDALAARQVAKRRERLVVARAEILRSADVPKVRVLGADARIVEPGGDRMRVGD